MIIIGIDPGPEHSGFCVIETDGNRPAKTPNILSAGKLANWYVREMVEETSQSSVAIEGMVYQGRGFGQSSIETCYFIGELRGILTRRKLDYAIYSRREYGQWTTGGTASLNDATIRAALENTWGPFAKKVDPLYQLRGETDKRSAFAIAKYHEFKLLGKPANIIKPVQEVKRSRKHEQAAQ